MGAADRCSARVFSAHGRRWNRRGYAALVRDADGRVRVELDARRVRDADDVVDVLPRDPVSAARKVAEAAARGDDAHLDALLGARNVVYHATSTRRVSVGFVVDGYDGKPLLSDRPAAAGAEVAVPLPATVVYPDGTRERVEDQLHLARVLATRQRVVVADPPVDTPAPPHRRGAHRGEPRAHGAGVTVDEEGTRIAASWGELWMVEDAEAPGSSDEARWEGVVRADVVSDRARAMMGRDGAVKGGEARNALRRMLGLDDMTIKDVDAFRIRRATGLDDASRPQEPRNGAGPPVEWEEHDRGVADLDDGIGSEFARAARQFLGSRDLTLNEVLVAADPHDPGYVHVVATADAVADTQANVVRPSRGEMSGGRPRSRVAARALRFASELSSVAGVAPQVRLRDRDDDAGERVPVGSFDLAVQLNRAYQAGTDADYVALARTYVDGVAELGVRSPADLQRVLIDDAREHGDAAVEDLVGGLRCSTADSGGDDDLERYEAYWEMSGRS